MNDLISSILEEAVSFKTKSQQCRTRHLYTSCNLTGAERLGEREDWKNETGRNNSTQLTFLAVKTFPLLGSLVAAHGSAGDEEVAADGGGFGAGGFDGGC